MDWFLNKRKVVLFCSQDAASVLRSAVAKIRRGAEYKVNVVIIKSTIDHDASGIVDEVVMVSIMFFHIKDSNIQWRLHEFIKSSLRLILLPNLHFRKCRVRNLTRS